MNPTTGYCCSICLLIKTRSCQGSGVVQENLILKKKGDVLYYTNQCPFNAKNVPEIEDIAKERSIQFKSICLQSRGEAQAAPTPITTYAWFPVGNYITNEQMNDKRFLRLLEKHSGLSS